MSSGNIINCVNSKEIISRVCEVTGLNQSMIANQIFDITGQALSNQVVRNRIDLRKILYWAKQNNINPGWLLYGDGHPTGGLRSAPMAKALTDDEREWFRDLISQLQEDKQDLKSKLAAVEKKPEPEQRKNIKKVT